MIFYTFALRGIYAALPQIRVQLQSCIETHDGPWSCKNGGPLGPKSSGMETADQQAKRVTTTNKLDACTWVKVVELRVRGGRRKLPTKITRGLRGLPLYPAVDILHRIWWWWQSFWMTVCISLSRSPVIRTPIRSHNDNNGGPIISFNVNK